MIVPIHNTTLELNCFIGSPGYTGQPEVGCTRIPIATPPPKTRDPCSVTDCGPYSICRSNGNIASCSCLPLYFGSPPRCRPECIENHDCQLNRACVENKCQDPCLRSPCGINAICTVRHHIATCACPPGLVGDASTRCVREEKPIVNPCPSACHPNALCTPRPGTTREASCACPQGTTGNPYGYPGCSVIKIPRPECVSNQQCRYYQVCVNERCENACRQDSCAQIAYCVAQNHQPICRCPVGLEGDPRTECRYVTPPPRRKFFL